MGKRRRPAVGRTRLVWEPEIEALVCEACQSILHWNFGFERCPYCRREITEVEPRRTRTSRGVSGSVIQR